MKKTIKKFTINVVIFRKQSKEILIKCEIAHFLNSEMDFTSIFRCFLLLLTTYLEAITSILLLTGTIENVNNGNILIEGRGERKYLEKKYNKAQYYQL